MDEIKQQLINDYLNNKDVKNGVNEMLERYLAKKEINIIKARFGLDDGKIKTLEELSAITGKTREMIRQIEVKALRKLRHPMNKSEFKAYFIY